MQKLSFEDLMNLFTRSQKNNDYDEVLNINKEFERRVNKRILMGKKPIRTSLSGLEQTQEWLDKNSTLKTIEPKDNIDQDQKKKLKKRLREDTDINKKSSLW
jgi:hypothetical protein